MQVCTAWIVVAILCSTCPSHMQVVGLRNLIQESENAQNPSIQNPAITGTPIHDAHPLLPSSILPQRPTVTTSTPLLSSGTTVSEALSDVLGTPGTKAGPHEVPAGVASQSFKAAPTLPTEPTDLPSTSFHLPDEATRLSLGLQTLGQPDPASLGSGGLSEGTDPALTAASVEGRQMDAATSMPALPTQASGGSGAGGLDHRMSNQDPGASKAEFFCRMAARPPTAFVAWDVSALSPFKQALVREARAEGKDEHYIRALVEMLARGDDRITWRMMNDQVQPTVTAVAFIETSTVPSASF
jgi:hypothetical protein